MGSNAVPAAQIRIAARHLLGRDALLRERIWTELKRHFRKHDRVGLGPIDIALWDLAGKAFGAPVHQLIGGYRTRLPAYASTYFGDENGGLSSPEAYADFAVHCRELGYRGFKVHGWGGPVSREVATVLVTREAVGSGMALMIDRPAATRPSRTRWPSGAPATRRATSGTRTPTPTVAPPRSHTASCGS
jgi:L-alanine-DL-glutamate epimerase-like enolase superfamily enzyme